MNLIKDTLFQNRYRLIKEIGKGGFSTVWHAKDEHTGVIHAIKIFAPDRGLDEWALRQFEEEFKLTYSLSHPNLLRPTHYDKVKEEGIPYLVMPYCENGSLHRLIYEGEKQGITEKEMARLVRDIGGALAYLHSREPAIIHQDIKPENILIDHDGNFLLADFGISKRMRSTMRAATQSAQSAMTIAYGAPEKYTNRPITPKVDVFSIGVMLYECLTGEQPWIGEGGLRLKQGADIPELSEEYPKRLNLLLKACMALDPEERPDAQDIQNTGKEFLTSGFWPDLPQNTSSTQLNKTPSKVSDRSTVKIDSGNQASRKKRLATYVTIAAFVTGIIIWLVSASKLSEKNEIPNSAYGNENSAIIDTNQSKQNSNVVDIYDEKQGVSKDEGTDKKEEPLEKKDNSLNDENNILPQPGTPKKPSSTSKINVSYYEVEVVWSGPDTRKIYLDDVDIELAEGTSGKIRVTDGRKRLKVVKPGQNLFFDDFIKIEPEKGILIVGLDDSKVTAQYYEKLKPKTGVFIDSRDGKRYRTVRYSNGQEWMAENLRYSGSIPQVTGGADWKAISSTEKPAWCYYDNNPTNDATYGKLYNWYAVNTGNLCPPGWHIPTDAEWTELNDYLGGGSSVAGGKMKSTTGWNSPNTAATNESGFSGLPGGFRGYDGGFNDVGTNGYWWSSSEFVPLFARYRKLGSYRGNVLRNNYFKTHGLSCRCLRD